MKNPEKGKSSFKEKRYEKASPKEVEACSQILKEVKKEVKKVFYGQEDVINSLLRGLLCNGHVILEGVPGIAKTLAIKALAKVSGCSFKRIQFTVDLLPADILGFTSFDPKKGFELVKGPIFANFIIADEINRSPAKTLSALIEAMQEKQVTIGKETLLLPRPFFIMANQNPIETEGVYNLPEAAIDRFLFKINFGYPDEASEEKIMQENVNFKKFEDFGIKEIVNEKKILELQELVHKVYLDIKIRKYIISIVQKTRYKSFKYGEYIELGASPRASIALYIGSKAEALLNGRNYVIPGDVKKIALDSLRHRLILSFRARAEKISPEMIIEEILNKTEVP